MDTKALLQKLVLKHRADSLKEEAQWGKPLRRPIPMTVDQLKALGFSGADITALHKQGLLEVEVSSVSVDGKRGHVFGRGGVSIKTTQHAGLWRPTPKALEMFPQALEAKSVREEVRSTLLAAATLLSGASNTDQSLLDFLTAIENWQNGDAPAPDWETASVLASSLRKKMQVVGLSDQIEAEVLRTITDAYKMFRNHGGREPSLTASSLRELMRAPSSSWGDMGTAKQTAAIEGALKRLKTKGKVTSSLGMGRDGREARVWEPV